MVVYLDNNPKVSIHIYQTNRFRFKEKFGCLFIRGNCWMYSYESSSRHSVFFIEATHDYANRIEVQLKNKNSRKSLFYWKNQVICYN